MPRQITRFNNMINDINDMQQDYRYQLESPRVTGRRQPKTYYYVQSAKMSRSKRVSSLQSPPRDSLSGAGFSVTQTPSYTSFYFYVPYIIFFLYILNFSTFSCNSVTEYGL